MGYRYSLMDNETGEILDGSDFKITKVRNTDKEFSKLCKEDVISFKNNEILDEKGKTKANRVKNYLERYLHASKQITSNHRIRIEGVWVDDNIFILAKDNNFEKEIVALISHMSSNYNTIKNSPNGRKVAKNWTDIYKFLKVHPRKQSLFKKFMTNNNMIRQYTRTIENLCESKTMYVNPKILRKYSHVGKNAIVAFKDFTLKDIHKYSRYWLYISEEIDEEDLNKNE